jgi:hypothetical protein
VSIVLVARYQTLKEGKDLVHRDYQTLIQLIETELSWVDDPLTFKHGRGPSTSVGLKIRLAIR